MSNWNEIFVTLSRLDANGNENQRNSLTASVSPPENDKLCATLIERSLAASVRSSNNNDEAMEIYRSIFGFE